MIPKRHFRLLGPMYDLMTSFTLLYCQMHLQNVNYFKKNNNHIFAVQNATKGRGFDAEFFLANFAKQSAFSDQRIALKKCIHK